MNILNITDADLRELNRTHSPSDSLRGYAAEKVKLKAECLKVYNALLTARKHTKNPQAIVYLNYAITHFRTLRPHELKTQIVYALANLSYWKGLDAQATKEQLKSFCKAH